MQMEEGLDTGPILGSMVTKIDRKTAGQLTEELGKLGAVALARWLENPIPPKPQSVLGITYAKKIDKTEARIEWSTMAQQVEWKVRAFASSPGAWFEANGERIKLLEAEVYGGHARAGEVLDDKLTISCSVGAIRPLVVQRAGRAVMTPDELLRGFAIPKGTILP
jgi:methionyl-tRNA formyltransferase